MATFHPGSLLKGEMLFFTRLTDKLGFHWWTNQRCPFLSVLKTIPFLSNFLKCFLQRLNRTKVIGFPSRSEERNTRCCLHVTASLCPHLSASCPAPIGFLPKSPAEESISYQTSQTPSLSLSSGVSCGNPKSQV